MTVVYGSSIEPGGMKLADDSYVCECEHCGQCKARHRNWQAVEGGSINSYYSVHCEACGLHDTNDLFHEDASILEFEAQWEELKADWDVDEPPVPLFRSVGGWLRSLCQRLHCPPGDTAVNRRLRRFALRRLSSRCDFDFRRNCIDRSRP